MGMKGCPQKRGEEERISLEDKPLLSPT